ncbi:hypothetical protein CROQUDRAFT_668198 [Cronartium quercuum f. sp. fusiforme G11]|uniref:Uncharacterized protein n=1 Tax=Cronartium quercuum f. sp. fusiforme G11 TaxID=708437 RepID=A0A9P6TGL5_9BASI|nr:hypothetical protein CROQUDRAFT_668198 [Cronartium quercuum f. sp. fusiforme G11]
MEKLDAKTEKNKLGVNDKGEVTGSSSGTLTTTANDKKKLHEEHSIQNTAGKSSKDEEMNEIIPSSGHAPDQSSDFIEQGPAEGDSNIRLESEHHNLFMSSSFEELGLTKETEPPHISQLMKVLVWFNPYRQAFFIIVWINIFMIILNLVKRFPFSDHNLSTFVTANILAAILFRNEWFLRFLHWAAVQFSRPRAFSVKARVTIVGIIYHIGGVHSGCGVAVLLWLFLSCYKVITDQTQMHLATFAVLILSTTCVLITCLTATPIVRKPCHNLFEFIHRFVGWKVPVFLIPITSFFLLTLW